MDKPHWYIHEDCNGRSEYGIWRLFGQAHDGRPFIGFGVTEASCIANLEHKIADHEKFLLLPDFAKIEVLIKQPKLYDADIQLLLKMMGNWIVTHHGLTL